MLKKLHKKDKDMKADKAGKKTYNSLVKRFGKGVVDESIKAVHAQMVVTNGLYDEVLDQTGIPDEERPFYKEMLVRHGENHLIASIWRILGEDGVNMDHLNDYVKREMVINPGKDHVSMLIEFCLLYPQLEVKVYESMDQFFGQFITDAKRIQEA
jgi:hypothetical protein